ncbi:hypothetical protein W59_08064 [Rhodococcus opacus RKJ300 = JCM 13270]|uniref:Uncharacterized protein n=1 Tax=Rhodococcus opacus RKJ300 = JCM 13270 TaxID=1165867 RepID=I0WVQ1_RHOOP|nr:hypothetical protein W59_08064 [Rhodococcus opacus RKJ300 = JCM 13270]
MTLILGRLRVDSGCTVCESIAKISLLEDRRRRPVATAIVTATSTAMGLRWPEPGSRGRETRRGRQLFPGGNLETDIIDATYDYDAGYCG